MKTAISSNIHHKRDWKTKFSAIARYKFCYLLLLPAIAFTFVFAYLPMAGIVIAFQDFNIFKGFLGSEFVGFDNFVHIFKLPKFGHAIVNTLKYSFVLIFVGFPLPILLALMFNELRNKLFKRVVQTISYLPYFLSWISVIALFYTFFALDGTFNDIRKIIFGQNAEAVNILMDPKYFLLTLFISHMWKNLGWSTVIYLAAITGIDTQLYEAAKVDGCSRLKQIIYITLPGILPTAMILLILASGGLVSANFEQVYGFQNLYTQQQTEVINTLIFRQGIQNGQYSAAAAFGLTQGLVSFLIIFATNKITKKLSEVSIW